VTGKGFPRAKWIRKNRIIHGEGSRISTPLEETSSTPWKIEGRRESQGKKEKPTGKLLF